MVVIGSVGLNVSMVFIQPQQHCSSEGLIIPISETIPQIEFCRPWIKEHAIEGNAKRGVGRSPTRVIVKGIGCFAGFGLSGKVNKSLFPNHIGICTGRESPHFVLGNGIGLYRHFGL